MNYSKPQLSWNSRRTGPSVPFWISAAAVCIVLIAGFALYSSSNGAALAREMDGRGLFNLTNIWTVHLRFSPEQWEAMEPKGGGFGGFGGGRGAPPGGPGGGGPGGGFGGGGPGGAGGFGPGMFIAPVFLSQGDTDKDGRFSKAEFLELGRRWFAQWDTNKSGSVDEAKMRAGLNGSIMSGPGARSPGGLGGGPGRGPGMNLLGPEGKRNGVAAMAGIEFNYVHADLEFEDMTIPNVGVRYKGNGTFLESRGALKRSLKIDLNHYIGGRHLGGARVLNLQSCVTDASFMNEVLAYQLYRDAGIPAPRTAYARVYLTVPGKHERTFVGLYSLVQNVDKSFLEENFGTGRGALFKPVTPSLFTYLGEDWAKYRQTYDAKTKLADDQKQRVIQLCKLVSDSPDNDFAAHIGEYIDVAQFARFMAVMVFLSDMDGILGPGQNLYLYVDPRTQLVNFLPWDQDHSWGQFPMRGTVEQRENLSINKPWDGDNNRFLERMYKLPNFRKQYRARLEEFRDSIFEPGRFFRQVQELAAALRPEVRSESEEKQAQFDKAVAGEPLGPGGPGMFIRLPGPANSDAAREVVRTTGSGEQRNQVQDRIAGPEGSRGGGGRFGGPGGFRGPGGFGQAMKPIVAFAPVRFKSIQEQLAGKSEGQLVGGFGGPGGRPGGPGGGPMDFGPGMFLGPLFLNAMDTDKNGSVTEQEMSIVFQAWFESWAALPETAEDGNQAAQSTGYLSEGQLRAGINRDLSPFRGGGPPRFGSPGAGGPGPDVREQE